MAMLMAIAERSLLAFGISLLILQLLAHEAGYWLGCRQQRKSDGRSESTGIVSVGFLAFSPLCWR